MQSASPARWLACFGGGDGLSVDGLNWASVVEQSTRYLPAVGGGLSLELRAGTSVRVDVSVRIEAGERHAVKLPPTTPGPIVETVRTWATQRSWARVPHVEVGFDQPRSGRAHPCVAVTLEPTEAGFEAMRGLDVDVDRASVVRTVLEVGSLAAGQPLAGTVGSGLRAVVESLPRGSVVHYVAPLSGRGRERHGDARLRLIVCMPTRAWRSWTRTEAGLPVGGEVEPLMRRLGMRAPVLSFDLDVGPDGCASRTGLYYSVRSFNRRDREVRDHLRELTAVFPETEPVMETALRWSDHGPDVNAGWCQHRALTTKLQLEDGVPVGAKAYLSLFGPLQGESRAG